MSASSKTTPTSAKGTVTQPATVCASSMANGADTKSAKTKSNADVSAPQTAQTATASVNAQSIPAASDKAAAVIDEGDAAVGVLGALKVKAKTDQGFIRAGIRFERSVARLLVVVEDKAAALAAEAEQKLCVVAQKCHFITPEQAKKIHSEAHLNVEPVDVSELVQSDTAATTDNTAQSSADSKG